MNVNCLFSQSKSALFIGNSYTYGNGLPEMLQQITISMGDELEVESNAQGGATLQWHSTSSVSLNLISSRDWDFVILQEQSQRPSFPPAQVAVEVYPFAEILVDSIYSNNVCTKPVFFMTWGYRNGDVNNCQHYPPLCTYEGQQWRLRQSYVEMAEAHNAWVAPCGMAFKKVRDNHPEIDLYQADNSHPSLFGSYLAACTFYSSLFHKPAFGAYFPTGISENQANILQNAAWTVVNDSIEVWNIDTTKLYVGYEAMLLQKNISIEFVNYSFNADSCFWDFGDGNSLMHYPDDYGFFENIEYSYENEGVYNVCLTAYRFCDYKKMCAEHNFNFSQISHINIEGYQVFPNPVENGLLFISSDLHYPYQIISMDGRIIAEYNMPISSICVKGYSPGIYILFSENSSIKFIVK